MSNIVKLLQGDEDYLKRVKELKKLLQSDSASVRNQASAYAKKYSKEIHEGTKKLQLLIEDGKRRGLSEDDVLTRNGFVPSKRTPVLNWIYFLNLEHDNPLHQKVQSDTKVLNETLNAESLTEKINYNEVNEPTDMIEHILGSANLDTFNKIKKLKALATNNPNQHESIAAEKACKKLCLKYDLEYSKIPV